MQHPGRHPDLCSAPRAPAFLLSACLHAALLGILLWSGDRHDGAHSADTPLAKLVLLEAPDAPTTEGLNLPPIEPAWPTPQIREPALDLAHPATFEQDHDGHEPPLTIVVPQNATFAAAPPVITRAIDVPPAITIPAPEQAALAERLTKLAQELATRAHHRDRWEDNGTQYDATLTLERATDGMAFDRVIAEVSAVNRGQQLRTRIALKRLPFSQFTHMVDRWDPMVQFHDDEIVGRVHSNTPFNLEYDSRTAPRFLGKVTTAARTFHASAKGRRRESDIFKGGIETRAGRIVLPKKLEPFEWSPPDPRARTHELTADADIRFFGDGSYTWQMRGAPSTSRTNAASNHPVYFIAAPGVTIYVRGIVAGQVLVYSPHKIVIEGNLVYAHDPRIAGAPDYLGLVCDKFIEIAPPRVTGSGDLEIHAAIFAGRRFVVTHLNHRRAGTLRIYGSLSVGSMSASEPRYATRLEYDSRFEQRRPPGFPSTNRFEIDAWDRAWTEVAERTAAEAL